MSQAQTGAPDQQRDKIVQSAIAEISHIATLPEVTMRIIKLVEDPDSTAQDLNHVISNDPALGARILKVVNSAFYGLPGQIGSINRAIVLLGLNAVKNIAIAASLAKLFRGGQICPGFNARDLWTHSIAVGTTTRLLANEAGLGLPDEAFLAGLIHDIGIMVEMQARRAKFIEVIEELEKDPHTTLREAEVRILGADHEAFGTGLCRVWKFPASFAYATGWHHRPLELAHPHRTLTVIVHIADILCASAGLGYSRTVECRTIDPELWDHVNLAPDRVEKIIGQLPDAIEEANALLSTTV
ncbi:MAG: HDOD domain-containing protein [Phycisphaeraceae bacterium]|nr:HDOD domain-containing protein [Phycisphaeraceae bacterium]